MLKNLLNKRKLQKGFTIIEVLIVLAIAGLILVVVLIAIPQLQRNQRNEARRSIVARMVTEFNNYAGNNNGNLPAATGADLGQVSDRYLGCTPTVSGSSVFSAGCTVNITDPKNGSEMVMTVGTTAAGSTPSLSDTHWLAAGDLGEVFYQVSVSCNGEAIQASAGRSFVLYTVLEGGAIACVDNS